MKINNVQKELKECMENPNLLHAIKRREHGFNAIINYGGKLDVEELQKTTDYAVRRLEVLNGRVKVIICQ